MADEGHDALAHALAAIVARHGEGVLEDSRRVTAMLLDTMADAGRQIRLLGIAIDSGAVRAIARVPVEQVELEIDRQAQRIDSDLGARQAIVPMLRAVAFATGRGALPSTLASVGTPPPSPQPTPAPGGMVGLGGWLLVWVAGLVLGICYFVESTVSMYAVFHEAGAYGGAGLGYRPLAAPALAVLGLVVLVLYVGRRKIARAAWCVWLLCTIGFFADYFRYVPAVWLPVAVIGAAGIAYLAFSRQARNTFVR